MQRMAEFSKISFDQFYEDWLDAFPALKEVKDTDYVKKHIEDVYDKIKLPKRATMQSAGYDFYSPVSLELDPGESVKIPTGVRCEMYDGWVLAVHPRSGLGFKYGLSLANTTGIIDGDYFYSDNEGHIQIKLVNDSCLAKRVTIDAESAFCQGVFLPYGITLDDNVVSERNGGFGSTDH